MEAFDAWELVSRLFVSAGVLIKALLLAVAPTVVGWWLNHRDKDDEDKEGPS